MSFSSFQVEKSNHLVVTKKLRQNLQACFLGVFLTHKIEKIKVIKILTNHKLFSFVTINKSISLFFVALFIEILFQTAIICNQGIHFIAFTYLYVFS
jgi:hypothetical protein